MQFYRKEYGRIFVEKEEDIPRVREIIKDMDEFEYSYLPEDLIAVYEPPVCAPNGTPISSVSTVYNGKFDDLDLGKLMFRCWNAGIRMFCVIGRYGDAVYE